MKKAVLPQPRRRAQAAAPAPHPGTGVASGPGVSEQVVEIVQGDLAGARGVVIRAAESGRWLIRLDGTTLGIVLSIPREGLRLIPARKR